MSPDTPEDSRNLIKNFGSSKFGAINFRLLSDIGARVINRYGFRNPNGSRANIPHPTTLVIDKQGRVRWRFTEEDFTKRPTNQQIQAELNRLR